MMMRLKHSKEHKMASVLKVDKLDPSWQDQLDDIYHNGIDGWKTTIKVTKDKYSK